MCPLDMIRALLQRHPSRFSRVDEFLLALLYLDLLSRMPGKTRAGDSPIRKMHITWSAQTRLAMVTLPGFDLPTLQVKKRLG